MSKCKFLSLHWISGEARVTRLFQWISAMRVALVLATHLWETTVRVLHSVALIMALDGQMDLQRCIHSMSNRALEARCVGACMSEQLVNNLVSYETCTSTCIVAEDVIFNNTLVWERHLLFSTSICINFFRCGGIHVHNFGAQIEFHHQYIVYMVQYWSPNAFCLPYITYMSLCGHKNIIG